MSQRVAIFLAILNAVTFVWSLYRVRKLFGEVRTDIEGLNDLWKHLHKISYDESLDARERAEQIVMAVRSCPLVLKQHFEGWL